MKNEKDDLEQINKEIEAELIHLLDKNGELENELESHQERSFQDIFELVMTIILIVIVLVNISIILVKLIMR